MIIKVVSQPCLLVHSKTKFWLHRSQIFMLNTG